MSNSKFVYSPRIESAAHADWCLREAELAYGGRVVKDEYGMLLVEDRNGLTHTDDVLRAVSRWKQGAER